MPKFCIPATSSNTIRMLNILTVANPSASGGSSIEVALFHYLRDAKPDIGKKYDLGSIGEVLAVVPRLEQCDSRVIRYSLRRARRPKARWLTPPFQGRCFHFPPRYRLPQSLRISDPHRPFGFSDSEKTSQILLG